MREHLLLNDSNIEALFKDLIFVFVPIIPFFYDFNEAFVRFGSFLNNLGTY